jgi:hypothetical protein
MIKGYSIYHLNDDVSAQSAKFYFINGFTLFAEKIKAELEL